jgi:O-antigen ligase
MIAMIIIVLSISGLCLLNKIQVTDSGRFGIWKQIWTDVTHSQFEKGRNYFITGHGVGAYKYLFTSLHTTRELEPGVMQRAFEEAHNEPLEWFYNTGIIGFGMLIFIVFSLIKHVFPYTLQDERYLALLISFVGSVLLACGTFIWQIEPHRYITVVVAAILYNRIIKEEKERWEKH